MDEGVSGVDADTKRWEPVNLDAEELAGAFRRLDRLSCHCTSLWSRRPARWPIGVVIDRLLFQPPLPEPNVQLSPHPALQ
jgi:hypothetical protein